MSYDDWKTRSPDDGLPDMARCHRCNALCGGVEDDYGEFVCDSCLDNAAEAAWDRHNESLMSGDAPTFRETYLAAYEQKRRLA